MRDIESSVLVFDHVSKRYARDKNRRFVLGPISFSLECGEVLRIQGDSGSGKTTVLRIAGLLTVPDRGGVHVCGEKATTEKSRDRLRAACIGIVFQDANLFGHLTVLQNLLVADQGKGNSAECLELLSRFGIRRLANVKAGRISGGELQRAGICRWLLYTSDAADDLRCVYIRGCAAIKKTKLLRCRCIEHRRKLTLQ